MTYSAGAGAEPHGGERNADLVLAGGGIRGIALAGVVTSLHAAGYRFPRIAGTSAGAILGSVTAAAQAAGEPLDRLREMALRMDFTRFADRSALGRHAGPLAPVVDVGSLLLDNGIFEGDVLRDYVAKALERYGVRTWADLRLPPDEGTTLPENHRYALLVTVSDVARRREVFLPWDYHEYGLDADEQSVADAVRMSAGLPFFYEPATLRSRSGKRSVMVDGGLLSGYPITVFDRTDGKPPRWPTFGVKLSAQPPKTPPTHEVSGILSYVIAILETVLFARDAETTDDPCSRRRTIFVPLLDISATDFDVDTETRRTMLADADRATTEFLSHWDFGEYINACHGGPR